MTSFLTKFSGSKKEILLGSKESTKIRKTFPIKVLVMVEVEVEHVSVNIYKWTIFAGKEVSFSPVYFPLFLQFHVFIEIHSSHGIPNERRMKALLTFNLNFAEVALHRCSYKKVFWKYAANYRRTPMPKCNFSFKLT